MYLQHLQQQDIVCWLLHLCSTITPQLQPPPLPYSRQMKKSIKSLLLYTCVERRICWHKVFWLYGSLGHLRKSVSLLMEIYPLWARSTTLLTFYVYLRKRRIFMSAYMHAWVLSIAKLVAKILWIQDGSFEEGVQILFKCVSLSSALLSLIHMQPLLFAEKWGAIIDKTLPSPILCDTVTNMHIPRIPT